MTSTLREIVNEYVANVPYIGEALTTERNLPDIDQRYYALSVALLTYVGLIYSLHYLNEKEARDHRVQSPPCEQQTNGGKIK